MHVVKLLFGFQGRIDRLTWWMATVLFMVLNLILSAVFAAMIQPNMSSAIVDISTDAMANGFASLVLMYPIIAIGVKRMHDRNKSGWWIAGLVSPALLLVVLLPLLLIGNPTALLGLSLLFPVLLVATVVSVIWNFVECGFLSGTSGDNDYGRPTAFSELFGGADTASDGAWANAIDVQAVATSTATVAASRMRAQSHGRELKPAVTVSSERPVAFGRRARLVD